MNYSTDTFAEAARSASSCTSRTNIVAPTMLARCFAERAGFEPAMEFPPCSISNRVPSTTQSSLRTAIKMYQISGVHQQRRRIDFCEIFAILEVQMPSGPLITRCDERKRKAIKSYL